MEKESPRFFQYIAGTSKGEVVLFDQIAQEDDMIFIEFKDGRRCNEDMVLPLNDFNKNQYHLMAEISDPNNIWRFKTEWVGRVEEKWSKPEDRSDGKSVCIQPFEEGRKKEVPIPPNSVSGRRLLRGNAPNFGDISVVRDNPTASASISTSHETKQKEKQNSQNTNDPVWQMMEAAKKFNSTVSVEMDIMLPKKSLFDVANESFYQGGEKIIEYIIENLDMSLLKDALRNSLYEAYGAKKEDLIAETIQETSDDMISEEIDEIDENEAAIDTGEPVALEEPIIGDPKAEPVDSQN